MEKELFFCLKKKVYVKNRRIAMSDICDIHGADKKPLSTMYFDLKHNANIITAFEMSILLYDIYPGYTVKNLGPMESQIFVDNKALNRPVILLKAIFLCLVMFFGGAFAIITFHEDVNMPGIHSSIYRFLTGIEAASVPIVSIPYSIGIAIGFILLFGLFSRKKSRASVLDLDIYRQENALKDYWAEKCKSKDE
ncbi:MAG: hypothetical protein ACOX8Q_07130 [Christensenellales bacterium]|jgi:stage V sporulation protein AA